MRIGVDFGGTKIEAAALDAEGRIIARVREKNPGEYGAALDVVKTLIERVEGEIGQSAPHVGFGTPGSISPVSGLMRNSNSLFLNGKPFAQDLERTLARPVRLTNDANCLAISEAAPDGAAAGARLTFAVILGTGCGGGLAIEGRGVDGHNGVAAEFGHIPLPWPTPAEYPGPRCWCGRDNCLELWISGTGLRDDYERMSGERPAGDVIIGRARDGDAHGRLALDNYISRLGRALAVVVNLMDPDVIVLGGGMSNTDEIYERVRPIVLEYAFTDTFTTPIRKALHGDSSGVRGAAWLWPDET
ncbi:MAG: transcriptional regulator [Caulobacterales bacterium 68-7]|nr:ROK family protein [Caulobacterales bacterium]OJU08436.1 MAG: transcriptional regulator [Caulobacterales bacterium 68-7]